MSSDCLYQLQNLLRHHRSIVHKQYIKSYSVRIRPPELTIVEGIRLARYKSQRYHLEMWQRLRWYVYQVAKFGFI